MQNGMQNSNHLWNQTYEKMTWQATQVSDLTMDMGNEQGPGTNTQTVWELKLPFPKDLSWGMLLLVEF